MHKLMKNKLGLHYVQTCKKYNFLNTNEEKYSCFTFIKFLIKALILGFELIIFDESILTLNISNFKSWRKPNEHIYFGKNN